MKLTGVIRWKCGCITGKGPDGEFVIQPHSRDCTVFKTALGLSQERGNTIEYRRDRAE